uniref:Snake toxin/toxin-like domain-containing protein n=1 Tax=Amazona collaria TaxID=241587 RepID=A0A8B9EVS0_9PSIT
MLISENTASWSMGDESLRCYTCKEPTDIAKCKTVTLCPPKSIVCSTTLHSVDSGYPFFGNITVTRNCEEECVSNDGIGSNKPKSCCYTDLCTDDNRSRNGVGPIAGLILMPPPL